MDRGSSIHIIGAGIAGLTTAIALQQAGFKPVLFEQATQLGEVGAGITVGPNAARVLIELGMEAKLSQHCWQPRHNGVLNFMTGERLEYHLAGEGYMEAFGAPFWHIHRADLLNSLAEELDLGGTIESYFGHKLVAVSQDPQAVTCLYENGLSTNCDVLIACDGIKSQVRDVLFESAPPEFTGFVAARGLVDRQNLPPMRIDPDFAIYAGQNRMVARYAVRNRSMINIVAMSQQSEWSEEGWTVQANVEELANEFDGWHESVTQILSAIPPKSCFKWALHTRKPMSTWVNGRVALLGDAAHPMAPFLGLGAGMGIEDAMVLARCFVASEHWPEALSRYESARVPRGNHAQAESSRQGLYLLNFKPGDPVDKSLLGEDALGLFGYDAVNVGI